MNSDNRHFLGDNISPKQRVYGEMLHTMLPVLRNISTLRWWQRLRYRRMFLHETELIHGLPNQIFEPGFTESDFWFLNFQARHYHDHCDTRQSPLYLQQLRCIRELFALVPEEMRGRLQWAGPGEPGGGSQATRGSQCAPMRQ